MDDCTQTFMPSEHTDFLAAKGYTALRFITNEKNELSLAILAAALDQALTTKDLQRLQMLGTTLKSLVRKELDQETKDEMHKFADLIIVSRLPYDELYSPKRLVSTTTVIKLFAGELVRSTDPSQSSQLDSEPKVWGLIKKLNVNLTVISFVEGRFSETVYHYPGPSIALLRVLKLSNIEYSYLLQENPQPDEISHDMQCQQCGGVKKLMAKPACGCVYCELCSPIGEVCKHCNSSGPFEPQCSHCSNTDQLYSEACEGGCTLCIACFKMSFEEAGLCSHCGEAMTDEALTYSEKLEP
jgi:hypothetical protein